MSYSLLILRRAQSELASLPPESFSRVCAAIRELERFPRPASCKKLTARAGWRIRVGDYRVVYEIDDQERSITILHIGHRVDIYR